MTFHLDDLTAVPAQPGCYLFYGKKEEILYIGKAKNLKKRLTQYFARGSLRKQDMLEKAQKVTFMPVGTESEALYLEDNLIKKHKPVYNSLLKADNSYVYIKISADPYPHIYTTRRRIPDGSIYLGPKHSTRHLYALLHEVRKILRYRTCTKTVFSQGKVCGDYHFGSCAGRCVYAKGIGSEAYQHVRALPANTLFVPLYTDEQARAENTRIARALADFFSGKTDTIEREFHHRLQDAIAKQHFEYAAQLRDIYKSIHTFTEKQHVVLTQPVTGTLLKARVVAGWFLVVAVVLYQGKMIDVLRTRYHTSDTQREDIVSDFRADYGDCTVQETTKDLFCFTKAIKKIPRAIRKEIDQLTDRFLDGMIASSTFEQENIMSDILQDVQKRYACTNYPYTMECVDISHFSGGRTSGAVVVMKEGLLHKKSWRKYKITQKGKQDDYASLMEVLTRRFASLDPLHDPLPDVFILDGGKGQLGIVKNLYEQTDRFKPFYERIHFCALGKGEARQRSRKAQGATEYVYRYARGGWNIQEKALIYDDTDRLLTTLRDEAHRFSNAYRKKQMSMQRST